MKYKALMLDVDGTTVTYDYSAVPSAKVTSAIQQAQQFVTVCIVTGRSFVSIQHILTKLEMHSGFAVVNNGAHIIDISSKKIVHEQLISAQDTKKITALFREEGIPFAVKGSPFQQEYVRAPEQEIPDGTEPPMFFTGEILTSEKADLLIKKLSHLENIMCHKTHHREPNKFGILISHVNATKQTGIFNLEKYIGVTRDQMIGVGDGQNDFPLLMACGLKVAMGNAVPELKEIADYVAPSVNDDGVADVIEKFILHPHA